MSFDVLSDAGYNPYVSLFYRILNEVVPELMDKSTPVYKRFAKAWSWYKFLCHIRECPQDVPKNHNEWDEKVIEKIANKLVHYAVIHLYYAKRTETRTRPTPTAVKPEEKEQLLF